MLVAEIMKRLSAKDCPKTGNNQEDDDCSDESKKDNSSNLGQISFGIFALFTLVILIFALQNVYKLWLLKKLRNLPLTVFYISSVLTLICKNNCWDDLYECSFVFVLHGRCFSLFVLRVYDLADTHRVHLCHHWVLLHYSQVIISTHVDLTTIVLKWFSLETSRTPSWTRREEPGAGLQGSQALRSFCCSSCSTWSSSLETAGTTSKTGK